MVLTTVGVDSDGGNISSKEQRESTYRSYAIFHLRTLLVLDSRPVQPEELDEADKRFGQSKNGNFCLLLAHPRSRLLLQECFSCSSVRNTAILNISNLPLQIIKILEDFTNKRYF